MQLHRQLKRFVHEIPQGGHTTYPQGGQTITPRVATNVPSRVPPPTYLEGVVAGGVGVGDVRPGIDKIYRVKDAINNHSFKNINTHMRET